MTLEHGLKKQEERLKRGEKLLTKGRKLLAKGNKLLGKDRAGGRKGACRKVNMGQESEGWSVKDTPLAIALSRAAFVALAMTLPLQ